MFVFWNSIIEPLLKIRAPRVIVEIGAEHGDVTEKLIEYASYGTALKCVVHSVDPAPQFNPSALANDHFFRFHKTTSLLALSEIGHADVILLDGDHNWYTVISELRLIHKIHGEKFPIVLIHDTGWPYGQRDLYYNPAVIPPEHRQPYAQKGIERGKSELLPVGGMNSKLYNACREGGPKNGVRTAIKDFLNEQSATEARLGVVHVPAFFGLTILFPGMFVDEHTLLFLHRFQMSPNCEQIMEDLENDRINSLLLAHGNNKELL